MLLNFQGRSSPRLATHVARQRAAVQVAGSVFIHFEEFTMIVPIPEEHNFSSELDNLGLNADQRLYYEPKMH